jgi:outer membrane protein TolC
MHRLVLAGLLPALLAAPGGAQNTPLVTEAEFLSRLDASHPAVAASAEDLALARARVVEASTLANPAVEVVREEPSGPSAQTDTLVSWQLPSPARRPLIRAREAAVHAAAARFEQRRREIRLEMREAYAAWALAVAREERLAGQAERVAALARREAHRAALGESSRLEAHRLELAAEALSARAAIAAVASGQARSEAARWVPTLPEGSRPALPDLPPAPGADTEHPLVRAAEADLAAARLEREAAGRFLASPELSLGWQRQELGAETLDGPLFGLAWAVPLFDRKRPERSAAAARVEGAEARLELVRREVAAARAAARANFERLARSLELAGTALAESDRMLDAAEAAFHLGEASLTDLLDTHRSVTEAALAVLDLQEAALAAHRELERRAAPAASPIPSEPLGLVDLEVLP